ncbi:MAG TPA: flavodoxin domain-containing protein [Aestuariivirgaceae bacterium]|jgi:menaquinone-dependent protoporphyrinogen oxidase
MRILIAYATSEGQTRKIAETVAAKVQELGHDAHLFDTATTFMDLHIDSYDKIVVASSVHQQRHQDSIEVFITARLADLQRKPTLFLSVSLSAAFSEGLAEAQNYVRALLAATGWKPTKSLLVAGALRYAEYDYFKEQIIQHIVLKDRKVERSRGDHEFTDWAALIADVNEFIRS